MSDHEYVHHHHPPKSRGGTKKVELPKTFENAWHTILGNLKGDEILIFMQDVLKMMDQKDRIESKELHDLREAIKRGDAQWKEKS